MWQLYVFIKISKARRVRRDHDRDLQILINQCLSPLMLWVRVSIRARCTTLCDKVCQWLVTGQWFSPDSPVFSTNKTDRHDIIEILLKVVLNIIKPNQSKAITIVCNQVIVFNQWWCSDDNDKAGSNYLFLILFVEWRSCCKTVWI